MSRPSCCYGWGCTSVVLLAALSGCCSNRAMEFHNELRGRLRSELPADMNPDAPPAEACADVPLLTAADLALERNLGKLVAIEGTPRVSGQIECTRLRCSDECGHDVPCCNQCTSHMTLRGPGVQGVRLEGLGIRCAGYDCAMHCFPFGNQPARPYRFVGRYVPPLGASPEITFKVERYCHVPEPTPLATLPTKGTLDSRGSGVVAPVVENRSGAE